MLALFALFCAGGAAADTASFTSLVAQLDDPLMKESVGSMQAQLSSLESRADAAVLQAGLAAHMPALQADNGAQQAHIDSLMATV